MNRGTLLLDLDTIATAPKFFSVLALVERAAGRKVAVMSERTVRETEKLAAEFGVPLTVALTAANHQGKLEIAQSLDAPVIWIDLALGMWNGPAVQSSEKLVTLNWKALREQGNAPVAERV